MLEKKTYQKVGNTAPKLQKLCWQPGEKKVKTLGW
jgi:hypothetical protein